MRSRPRSLVATPNPNARYKFYVLNAPRPDLRDVYHWLLRMPFWGIITLIVASYLGLNLLFGALYYLTDGIGNAAPGSFADAFFFSVHTLGTIGYGSLYPASRLANVLVVIESLTGLLVTALATGLMFVRFSQTRPRVVFSRHITIGSYDGVPTLMIRLGNERGNYIFDVMMRLTIQRTTRSAEGVTFYRTLDLPLVREHAPALTRAWTALHTIDNKSPLSGLDAEALIACEAELTLAISGTDDTSLQPVYARYTWYADEILWDMRLADVLTENSDGDMVLDLAQFHEVAAVAPGPVATARRPAARSGAAAPPEQPSQASQPGQPGQPSQPSQY
jgi:inward rectifier potassium channel